MKQAIIALGSNLEQPERQLQAALDKLAAQPQIEVRAVSSFYRTAPVGYAEQPDFVNAVALLATDLLASELLALLQSIEAAAGRVRTFRNAPRTLDLDIIDYAGQTLAAPDLQLPHPRAHQRGFVMIPLAEIAPQHLLPGQTATAAELAAALGNEGVQRIGAGG
ncbi:2-amino-4-hydroxy-6-hydroxymethyldihydropteridine diphosphokinase [Eikenella sp. S3360]|uniref:2-amino-4-hydroxy-6-hydroxymethyldihydropteridine pyrophosphokinase n=1 Tax=Eikenella glucosivorans TaxID=2766967 RepID=A0ABS0NAP8_9NEIS|nr:2-amino-4-hydroxy-6-hydroxymethyldihydropteridine diphosphokinase [Eikenella glucosivorans]MBH5329356.1 2-amino-4-hydroxy-6-hydroxymethyldihydropteridine diphosphokinase [Eikenella glucosivorans]